MELQIRYCTSADGTRIAYASMGKGYPFLFVQGWGSSIEHEWEHPNGRAFLDTFTKERRFIAFDRRGVGSSQREIDDISLPQQVADVAAIADSLHLERFDLGGNAGGAAISVGYAAQYPERVSRLVLWSAFSHGKENVTPEAAHGLRELIRGNWSLARRTISEIVFPNGPIRLQQAISNQLRECIAPETAAKYVKFFEELDVRLYLPEIKAPTLVLQGRACRNVPLSAGKEAAALIPNARFIALEGAGSVPICDEISFAEKAVQFLIEEEEISIEARAPQRSDLIGKTITHYRILEKLGEGGMGVVYKAEDTKLERTVALKFLSSQTLGGEEEKIRFIREAKAAAKLDHPNICTVYEIDEAEEETFIAMAYIEGASLEEKVESGHLEIRKALEIAIQLAEGLQEAHRRGIVHRDIKSQNIMLDSFGRPRIMDFGLAKLSGKTKLTKTATIMGTVSYMSPEQARGDATIDHRTDIWSLGVVLYEMLTGSLPFIASTDAGLLYRIIHEDPEPIDAVRSDIPEALEHAIKKAMRKDPQDRYEDMEALKSDLKAIRSGVAPVIGVEEKTTPSIAVLPFADMSPQKDQEYFCDGISESLINALTQIADLRVIARTSAFSFKGQNIDVREIGKKLNVGTVLEGSIQKAGDKVRVTAQLVNTAHNEHLWSEKYDRDMQDIFAIQDEITLAIVNNLKPMLLGKERTKLGKQRVVDLEVYNLYLRGRWFSDRQTEDGLEKAIDCFEQALIKEPNYAPAHASLAGCYTALAMYGFLPARETLPKAREAAAKALLIDPELVRARVSLASIKTNFDWDWEGAEAEFKQAIKLSPTYARAHHLYGVHLTCRERFDDAIGEVQQALKLDPLALYVQRTTAWVFLIARMYDKAIEAYEALFEMDPNYSRAHLQLGRAYHGKSMYQEALSEFQKEIDLVKSGDGAAEMYCGITYAKMGKRDDARKMLNTLLERSAKEYLAPTYLAQLHFALGQNDQGFDWLNKAYEDHEPGLSFLKVSPGYDPIHSDPRYKEMLKNIGLAKPDATVPIIEPSPSIAVLPFVNMSADPEQEYFCDGLAEELINALTQIKDLHVVARTSAFSFKGQNIDVREIGKKLNVKTVLEGSVRKAGNRLRITGQLVKVSDGYHLWSEKYDREMEDIFAIQDEITEAIVDRLKPALLGEEKPRLAKHKAVDLEAYNFYLRGRWFWGKTTASDLEKAIQCFGKAIEKSPDYALAYSGLADSYFFLPHYGSAVPKETYPKAREAALKALEIDDTVAEAHASLAMTKAIYEWDWEGADKSMGRAIELNPGYAWAHHAHSMNLMFRGRFDEAIGEINRALELDPLSVFANRDAGQVFLFARKPDRAIEMFRRALEMAPNYGGIHSSLGAAYWLKSMYEEAIAEFEKEKRIASGLDPVVEHYLGIIAALTGRIDEAQKVLEKMVQRSKTGYFPGSLIAVLSFTLEEIDEGFEWLERAYEQHDNWLSYLKVNPAFEMLGVCSDPRYHAMLKKINLAD